MYANRYNDMMTYHYANIKNDLHGIAFKGRLVYAMRAGMQRGDFTGSERRVMIALQ